MLKPTPQNSVKSRWWNVESSSTEGVKFENFNEAEDSTIIDKITFLQFSFLKTLCAIILSPVTVMTLTMYIYWFTSAKKYWFFKEVSKIDQASFVYIEGKPGNKEIIRIKDKTKVLNKLLSKNLNDDLKHLAVGKYKVSYLLNMIVNFRPSTTVTLLSSITTSSKNSFPLSLIRC